MATVHAAQHGAHHGFVQTAAAVGDGLVGERQAVAHRAARRTCQQAQRAFVERHVLGAEHTLQVFTHGNRSHRPQVELQATAQHRGQHLVRVRRGQDELQVLGRLFQGLEQRVEGVLGQLVRLVDHEDLEAADAGLVGGALDHVAHLVDAAVAGCVQFDVVEIAVGVDLGAGLAHAAGLGRDAAVAIRPRAVQALGQDAADRGLSDAPRAREEVGVVQALRLQGVAEGLHDVLLPDHLREGARTVLAGQDNIGRHAPHSMGAGIIPRHDASPSNPAELRAGGRAIRPDRPLEGRCPTRRRRHRRPPGCPRVRRGDRIARRIGLCGGRRPLLPGQHRRVPGHQDPGGRRDGHADRARATTTASPRTPSPWR